MSTEVSSRSIFFIDVNETLIRTGELTAPQRLEEAQHLNTFVELIRRIAMEVGPVHVIFISGNTFEYCRRVEEPLGLKNMANVEVTIVSENGLIGRSFTRGDLWSGHGSASYREALTQGLSELRKSSGLEGRYFTQGNEARLTLKPAGNTFSEEELGEICEYFKSEEAREYCRIFQHPFYVDIDPLVVCVDGQELGDFDGKGYAVKRLLAVDNGKSYAFGDSSSDLPMFLEVLRSGGDCYWVGNTPNPHRFDVGTLLEAPYTQGVNQVLEKLTR